MIGDTEDGKKCGATTIAERSAREVRVTPDGRRLVDPMSIIGSESAKKHLKDLAEPREPNPTCLRCGRKQ